MNRAPVNFVAIVVGGGILWAMTGLVPPSKETAHSAFDRAKADGSAHFDTGSNTVWSVPG